ncbi:putative serine protease HhoA precursor [mine drainage metagenome]|uniref:Putative serine protease HhoA n=1 Tax=mine drainage metagenome TaxID=410659 RepID=A0A1J5QPB2_9ZZZZ
MDDNGDSGFIPTPGGTRDSSSSDGAGETLPVEPRARQPRRRRTATIVIASAVALGLATGGAIWSAAQGSGSTAVSADSSLTQQDTVVPGSSNQPDQGGGAQARGSEPTALSTTAATATQQVGLVTIVSTLGYQEATSAGTGIVLTSDGTILTNNHVIVGATAIEVTVESTGATYPAQVVGTDATADIAVLRLTGASGLATATIATGGAAVGDAVTAVGNAGGGGSLVAAAGTVTALDATVTTQDEVTGEMVTLGGLLQIDADVVAGDSGGAVLNTSGAVVGMTTAASTGTSNISGYGIAIDRALSIAHTILAGTDTSTTTIGYPAFLGVEAAGQVGRQGATATAAVAGALVAGVIDGTPTQRAGLAAGDTITAIGGVAVGSADALSQLLSGYAPGAEVTVTWTSGTTGASQTATVTLIAGPAD